MNKELMFSSNTDEWYTPLDFYKELDDAQRSATTSATSIIQGRMTMEKIHDCNKCFLAYCNCKDRRISCDDEEYSGDCCEWYEPYLKPEELTKHETRYYGDVPFKLVASEYHCPVCGAVLEEEQDSCSECGCWIDWED